MNRKWVVITVIAVVLAAAGLMAWRYRKVIVYAALITFGHSKCAVRDVVTAKANLMTGDDVQNALRLKSRRIRSDSDGFALWETPDGNYWDLKASTVISVLSEQERNIYTNRPDQSLRPGDVVFDCGASIGVFTRKALKSGAKKVVAVEPAPESLECLHRNFEAEIRNGTVVVIAKGVFDPEGELSFLNMQDDPMGSRFILKPGPRIAPRLVRLPITTIDKLVEELALPRVDFIKMDIEGSERYALKGAERTLKRFHPRMAVCTYHLPDDPDVIPAVVESFGIGYRMQCGACSITDVSQGHFRPAVMFFN
jgi:FkbM family methyltransferase